MSNNMKKVLVPILACMIFVFYFFLLEDIGIDYWDTYIAAPATFVAGKPCTFINEQGEVAFAGTPLGRLPDDLYNKQTYGIVSKDQRIGAGVTFATAYRVFGMFGFRLLYAAFGALAFLLAYQLGCRLFGKQMYAIAFALIISVNPFMISMNRLNANFITVSIMMGLAALIFAERPRWLIIGLVYGALGGIRNEAIMLVPALCLLMLSTKHGRKGFAFFGAGAVVGIAPYLMWNKFAFGKALIHASQFEDFQGWRPMFRHEIFGWEFSFNGLFNWPFHDVLVRTPHYPFPTYLTIPLTLILCFGVGLTAFAMIGLFAQWKKSRVDFGFWFLWAGFCLGLFVFQENWEEPKTTFSALAIPPIGVFMVRGIQWLAENVRNWRRWAAFVCVLVILQIGIHAAGRLTVPVDTRWYERFPKAKTVNAQIGCLTDEQRREWMLFHTNECPAELAEQKQKLTKGNLLPRFYYPLRFHPPTMREEWMNHEPRIFDIWEKIYGY